MGSRERSDWLPLLPGGRSQPCLWCWRSVSQRGVWSDGVVVDAPALGRHAQFFDRVEEFAVRNSSLSVPVSLLLTGTKQAGQTTVFYLGFLRV